MPSEIFTTIIYDFNLETVQYKACPYESTQKSTVHFQLSDSDSKQFRRAIKNPQSSVNVVCNVAYKMRITKLGTMSNRYRGRNENWVVDSSKSKDVNLNHTSRFLSRSTLFIITKENYRAWGLRTLSLKML